MRPQEFFIALHAVDGTKIMAASGRRCSRDPRGRGVEIGPHHQAMERQRRKRREKGALLRQRQVIAEPVMAWIKCHLDSRRWTVRGRENVRTQWALLCATVNLKKLFRHWQAGGG